MYSVPWTDIVHDCCLKDTPQFLIQSRAWKFWAEERQLTETSFIYLALLLQTISLVGELKAAGLWMEPEQGWSLAQLWEWVNPGEPGVGSRRVQHSLAGCHSLFLSLWLHLHCTVAASAADRGSLMSHSHPWLSRAFVLWKISRKSRRLQKF